MRVETWTCDRSTKDWMKTSRLGRAGCMGERADPSNGGDDGGVGGRCLFVCMDCEPHLMTCEALCARYDTIVGDTGSMMK